MKEKAAPRTGVIICECGGEIARVIDTQELNRRAAEIAGVVYSNSEAYPCSKDGLDRMRKAIHEYRLERVLIAGCSARLVEKLFQEAAEETGLHPGCVEIVNIREGCAYIHPADRDPAFQKSVDIIKMGVAHLTKTTRGQVKTIKPRQSVLVIGSGLSGLSSALFLASSGIPVFLVEESDQPGGTLSKIQDNAVELVNERIEALKDYPNIHLLTRTKVQKVRGQPGDYQIWVSQNGEMSELKAGAVLIAGGAYLKEADHNIQNNGHRIRSLFEFEQGLCVTEKGGLQSSDIVFLLSGGKNDAIDCSPLICDSAIRQALRVKQLRPDTNVNILFQDLNLGRAGGKGEQNYLWAEDEGIGFFPYEPEHPPVFENGSVELFYPNRRDPVRIACEQLVAFPTILPGVGLNKIARLFQIPQDKFGFLIDQRIPLRPGNYFEEGIYVLGSAHKPVDSHDALFQAYLTVTRVLNFLYQESLSPKARPAEINSSLCTGCGICAQECPMGAIHIEQQEGVLSQAEVYDLRCTGCGSCAVVCPVKAITIPDWNDQAIMAQIDAAFERAAQPTVVNEEMVQRPRILAITCEWSALLAAEISGARRLACPVDVRILPVNCFARIDPDHILLALINGVDGVFIGACHPCECHYGSGGLDIKERVANLKTQLEYYGIDPARLHLEFIAGDDGAEFSRLINDFADHLEKPAPFLKPYRDPSGGLDVKKVRSGSMGIR